MGPFEAHVREAIEVNRRRASHYAALTGGRSGRVFRRYLFAERFVLPFAAWFDRRAAPYEAAGVPLLSSVFESMKDIAPATGVLEPRGDDGWSPDVRAMVQKLTFAFRTRGFEGLSIAADECLQTLSARPWRDCMLRHQLESLRRAANVSPINVQRAIERGLPSPERLIGRFLRFHLQGVRIAPLVDRPALPLQLRGVPILENDLPQVAPWPAGDDWSGLSAPRGGGQRPGW